MKSIYMLLLVAMVVVVCAGSCACEWEAKCCTTYHSLSGDWEHCIRVYGSHSTCQGCACECPPHHSNMKDCRVDCYE